MARRLRERPQQGGDRVITHTAAELHDHPPLCGLLLRGGITVIAILALGLRGEPVMNWTKVLGELGLESPGYHECVARCTR